MENPDRTSDESVEPGKPVYSDDGTLLGRVRSVTEEGFSVEPSDEDDPDGVDQETIPGQEFGEGYLMWECAECGEMGDLDGEMPESCPNCGAPREAIAEARED